ncbi:MAG: hypothetical protein ABI232_03760 [Jatrophihabitantaceae bacterium]
MRIIDLDEHAIVAQEWVCHSDDANDGDESSAGQPDGKEGALLSGSTV